MKIKSSFPFLGCLALLSLSIVSARCEILVTFDDLVDTHAGGGTLITNSYEGLVWSNFAVGNVILQTANFGLSGYYYGMLTPSNVAVNAHGGSAEIDAAGTDFDIFGTYLTGAWRSNLSIEVQGYRDTNLVYDEALVASATNPTLFTLDYLDIDRLVFNSFGGQYAGFSSDGEEFAMDNFMFDFIPEPSSFLLAALGGVSLVAFLRRERM